jgi:hypothetical protein
LANSFLVISSALAPNRIDDLKTMKIPPFSFATVYERFGRLQSELNKGPPKCQLDWLKLPYILDSVAAGLTPV